MHISLIYLVITSLIYASLINSQPYRGAGGLPMDDLVAAIATAAINGAIPFNKINLRNPRNNGQPLRIPILLIKHNDLNLRNGRHKFNPKYQNDRQNWNQKNGKGFNSYKNDRSFFKQDYYPKPKFPTNGMKIIPAPKIPIRDHSVPNRDFDRPQLNVENERFRDREPLNLPERQNENIRFPERQPEREYDRQPERLPERQPERLPERQPERLPERQPERLPERLPEREFERQPEKLIQEQPNYDNRPVKPIIRAPKVVKHVYTSEINSHPTPKPTIPPRYLKPLPQELTPVSNDDIPLKNFPPISEILPPIKEDSEGYKTEPIVNHKYVNLGEVYRKANSEEQDFSQDEGSTEEALEGYAKDPYDKQLVNTLKNLMSASKGHPLNIGGLEETASKEEVSYNPATKVVKTSDSYYTNSNVDKYSSKPISFSQAFSERLPQSYNTMTTTTSQNEQLLPQSLNQYVSTPLHSKIPESLLSKISSASYNSDKTYSTGSVFPTNDKYSTNDGETHMVQLMPGQVSSDMSTNRKPVSIDFDYNTDARPLPSTSFFSGDDNQKSAQTYGQSKTIYRVNTEGTAQESPTSYSTVDQNFGSYGESPAIRVNTERSEAFQNSPHISTYFPQQNDQNSYSFGRTEGNVIRVNTERSEVVQSPGSHPSGSLPAKTYVVTGLYHKQIQDQDKNMEQEQYDDKLPSNSDIKESYANVFDGVKYPSVESEKKPLYIQIGSKVFFQMGPKGNLINTSSRNNRPSQKVSKNLLVKTQELNNDREEDVVIDNTDVNNNQTVSNDNVFSCENRTHGYYADFEHDCQIYYQCYLGGSYKFFCPNNTQFDQERLLCDWPENVNCEEEKESNKE